MKFPRDMYEHLFESEPIRKVVRGGSGAFVIHVAAVGMTYCSQLLIARMIGVDSFGVYAYVTATMVVLAYFAAFGFDVAILRFVPAYEAQHRWDLLRGVISYAERRVSAIGIAIILIGGSIVALRGAGMSIELRNSFFIGLMLVPIWALIWIRCSTIRAFGGVVWSIAPDRLLREGMVIVLVAVATLGLRLQVDASQVVAAALVSSIVGLALTSVAMHQLRPPAAENVECRYDAVTWRRVAVPLVTLAAAEALMNRSGVLILGWFGDMKDAGIYSLVFNIAFVVVIPRTAFNTLFAPAVSSYFTRNDHATLQLLVASAATWTFVAAAAIGIVLAVVAGPLLSWFGPGLEDGVPALRVLLLGQTLTAGAGSQLYVMTMTGHERIAAALLIGCAVLNGIASTVLIGFWGLIGAAIATSGSLIIWNLAMAFFLWRHMRFLPGLLGILRARLVSEHGQPQGEGASL